jgi:dihydrofolate synthase/folylpolyglutamate synthase
MVSRMVAIFKFRVMRLKLQSSNLKLPEVTYPEAIDSLLKLNLFGSKLGLDNPRRLTALAGSPHERLRFIHVAGTNGKGSVCAMLESIYRETGLRTGLFTSPHLVSFRERIQVNREPIPEDTLARLTAQLRDLAADFPDGQGPTFFEMATVMALCYFAEQSCDIVLWETGLGGRLDATNIVTPLASVITNIGLDHTRWLGETHAAIAAEKAGIIKPGVPALTAAAQPEALAVIRAEAARHGAELIELGQAEGTTDLPLLGRHQQTNASLAKAVVEQLQAELPVSPGAVRGGLAKVHWPGRLQVVRRGDQIVLLDGAHNAEGAAMLRQALADEFSADTPVFIFGMVDEKDGAGFCAELAPLAKRVVLSPVSSARSAKPEGFVVACQAANPAAAIEVAESLGQALEWCAAEPVVVVTGSFYLVGEAMERLGLAPTPSEAERRLNDWGAAMR